MCGIVYKHNLDGKPVNNDILQQYDIQKRRGTRGFGVFDGRHLKIARETTEDKILRWLVKHDSSMLLFHHRYPTSTINVAKAAHPLSTGDYFGKTQYILVHNGVIRNPNVLFVNHQTLGIEYKSMLPDLTFNDSESLLWDIALTLEGRQPKMKAYGSMAFIVMKKVDGKLRDMYFGRNTNPLVMWRDKNSIELSSEGVRGKNIQPNTLFRWNYKEEVLHMKEMVFPGAPAHRPVTSSATGTSKVPYAGSAWTGKQPINTTGYQPTEFFPKKEYDNMHDYFEDKKKQKAESNWERLRRQYGKDTHKLLEATAAEPQTVGQIVGEVLEARSREEKGRTIIEVDHIDVDEVMRNKEDFLPDDAEIQRCAMEYIMEAEGNFEKAYTLLEENYGDFMEQVSGKESFDDIRQQLLMEKALEFINCDPEYQSGKTISSIWNALKSQQLLAVM